MSGAFRRLALAVGLGLGLAGCASEDQEMTAPAPESNQTFGAIATPKHPLECVPFARVHSGIDIYGDAYTWWSQAAGKWARGHLPQEGAVMVLNGYAGRNRAHVAVVRKLVSAREIKVDHANWLDDGAIYLDDPVADVSPDNDWSEVRVWNIRAGAWGSRTYAVQGFVGPEPDSGMPSVARQPVISLN